LCRMESRCFNPRPAFARGATKARRPGPRIARGFNPRPAFARGATNVKGQLSLALRCFNPRPAFARGATNLWPLGRPRNDCFNPRPAFARGATFPCGAQILHKGFQSAPRVRTRGDRLRPRIRDDGPVRFNPRPAFARGATGSSLQASRWGIVSIRAPRSHAGRLRHPDYGGLLHMQFQSAPRVRTRGDVY